MPDQNRPRTNPSPNPVPCRGINSAINPHNLYIHQPIAGHHLRPIPASPGHGHTLCTRRGHNPHTAHVLNPSPSRGRNSVINPRTR